MTCSPIERPKVVIIERMPSRNSLAVFLILGLLQASRLCAQESNAQESIVLDMAVVYEPMPGEYGVTELMIAAMYGDSGKVRELLEAGANVDDVNDIGATAFMGAAYAGDLAVVEVLLEWNADVNHLDNKGDTVLGSVVWGRDSRMAGVLLANGANPNVTAYASDSSVLQHAAVTGQAEIVDLLISHGADLTAYGEPSLAVAAWRGETGIVRTLLTAGVAANAASGYGGRTAIHMAAENDHADTIILLIEHGADVNWPASDESVPLHSAINKNFPETVGVLLGNGAEVSSKDLLLALQRRNTTVIDAVFRRVDFVALTNDELDEIFTAADGTDHLPVIDAILRDSSHRLAHKPARLLFAKKDAEECAISLWNPDNRNARTLVTYDNECPEHAFVAAENDAVFVIADGMLHIVPFDRRSKTRSIELPNDQIDTRLIELQRKLEAQMLMAYGRETSMKGMTAESAAAGILDSGEIGLSINSRGPADGTDAYLYALQANGNWVMVEEQGCDRYEWRCEFKQLNGRRVEYWPVSRKIWNPRIRTNEYFASKTRRDEHVQWDYGRPDVVRFNVDGRKTVLAYSTGEETHSDYIATSLVEFALDELAPPNELCRSCETSLASRYLLIGDSWNKPFRLIDIGTGDSVLGPLEFATWVE